MKSLVVYFGVFLLVLSSAASLNAQTILECGSQENSATAVFEQTQTDNPQSDNVYHYWFLSLDKSARVRVNVQAGSIFAVHIVSLDKERTLAPSYMSQDFVLLPGMYYVRLRHSRPPVSHYDISIECEELSQIDEEFSKGLEFPLRSYLIGTLPDGFSQYVIGTYQVEVVLSTWADNTWTFRFSGTGYRKMDILVFGTDRLISELNIGEGYEDIQVELESGYHLIRFTTTAAREYFSGQGVHLPETQERTVMIERELDVPYTVDWDGWMLN